MISFNRTYKRKKGAKNEGRPNKKPHQPSLGWSEKFRNGIDIGKIDYVYKDENGSLQFLLLVRNPWQAAENIDA